MRGDEGELDAEAREPWSKALVELTAEGVYADPDNGGNRDAAAWAMIGYEHRLPEGPSGPPRQPDPPARVYGATDVVDWDVIVVGGGAGGGSAASVLAALSVPWVVRGDDTARRSSRDLVATEPPAPAPEDRRGWWDMPATGMVDAIEAILPDGVVVTSPGPLEADTPEGGPAHGWINAHLEAATGPGRLNVMLYPAPADGEGTPPDTDLSCDEELAGHTTCQQLRDETGTVVGRRLTSRWGGTVMREVVMVGLLQAFGLASEPEAWVLAFASRIWLTLLEVVPGLLFLALGAVRPRRSPLTSGDASP